MAPADPAAVVRAGPGDRRPRALDVVLDPVREALAPASGERVARRIRNAAVGCAVLTLLLPPLERLGTGAPAHAHLVAAAFAATAIVSHFVHRTAWGDGIAAAAAILPAVVVRSVGGPGAWWAAWFAALAVGSVAASRVRRRVGPPTPPDPEALHGGPRTLAGLAASVMAVLVVRTFVLLPIHVPTGSMEPTILGRGPGRASEDRLLVDQTAWLLRGPARFDVAVFEYPLRRDINFVKRVIGLPGERIEIRDGDVWADGRIVRKPPLLQETLWREIFPRPHPTGLPKKPGEAWVPDRSGGEWTMDGGWIAGRSDGRATATFRLSRRPDQGDLRLRCVADPATGAVASLVVTSRGTDVVLRVPHAVRNEPVTLRVGSDAPVALPCDPVRDSVALELAVADGEARVFVRGAEAGRAEVPLEGTERHGLALRAEEGRVRFRDLRADQDQRWRPGASTSAWKVPDDAYFVLGDNIENSMDARSWRVTELHVRGRAAPYLCEPSTLDDTGRTLPNLRREGTVWRFVDVGGIERRVPIAEIDRRVDGVPFPFVPRDHLVGRAAMIFWPWGFGGGPFRPRLLP